MKDNDLISDEGLIILLAGFNMLVFFPLLLGWGMAILVGAVNVQFWEIVFLPLIIIWVVLVIIWIRTWR